MCLGVEIILAVMGVWALFKGKLKVTNKLILEDTQARIVGSILLVPIVVLILAPFSEIATVLEFWLVIGAIVLAVILGMVWRESFTESIEMTPSILDEISMPTLANAFRSCETGEYVTARQMYQALVKADAGLSVGWYNLGITEFRAGNFRAAAKAFEQVIKLKEHLSIAAYAKVLCDQELDLPLEVPSEYPNEPEVLGIEGPIRNLAHELQNRGYTVFIKLEGERCEVQVPIGEITYIIALFDIMGFLGSNFYRKQDGETFVITDPDINPNPTKIDKEFIAFQGKLKSLRLAQMPINPEAMDPKEYRQLSKAAERQAQTQEVGPHGWTRRGQTFEEALMAKYATKGANVTVTNIINFETLIQNNEPGTFTVCTIDDRAHLVAKIASQDNDLPSLGRSVEKGLIILRASCYIYSTYPIIYNRVLIPLIEDSGLDNISGILIESATDFTNANFQEWAITLQHTRKTTINIYNDAGLHLVSGEAELEPEVINSIIMAINQANTALKDTPAEQQDFRAAAQAFFREHPEPFLFD